MSELVRIAEEGKEVVLARGGGQPVAKLVPISPNPTRRLGLWQDSADRQPEGWDEKSALEELMPELDNQSR